MNAEFDNLDVYLDELKLCVGRSVVRAQSVREAVNDGVTGWSVVSGFHDDQYFYQLNLDCGQDYAGGPGESESAAKSAVGRIAAFCEERGYAFRGGVWCRPE